MTVVSAAEGAEVNFSGCLCVILEGRLEETPPGASGGGGLTTSDGGNRKGGLRKGEGGSQVHEPGGLLGEVALLHEVRSRLRARWANTPHPPSLCSPAPLSPCPPAPLLEQLALL